MIKIIVTKIKIVIIFQYPYKLSIYHMEYFTIKDLKKVQLRINLKRIIDENNILRNQICQESTNEIHFTLDLYGNGGLQTQRQSSKIFVFKNLFDQPIIFNWFYEDLALDSKIAISIWSSAKKFDEKKPLGSTIVPIFDERGNLRQGKFHLFIWPDVLPDIQQPSTTPCFTNDQNIETINFITSKLQQFEKEPPLSKKIQQSLKLKLTYTYRLIPAAFLEIQFPKFLYPVLYTDKISEDFEKPIFVHGGISQINQAITLYDPDFEAQRPNVLEQAFYQLRRENESNKEKKLPSREQTKEIDKILTRSFKIDLKPAEKDLFLEYAHHLSQDKKYLCYYLHSLSIGVSDSEVKKLLNKWEKIDLADALHILSRQFSVNVTYNKRRNIAQSTLRIIRNYAVEILHTLSNEQLSSILLQLVQTLRYDDHDGGQLFIFLTKRAVQCQQVAISLYWYLRCESQSIENPKQDKAQKEIRNQNIQIYQNLYEKFQQIITENNPELLKIIKAQVQFTEFLRKLSKQIKEIKDMDKRKAQMRKRLAEITEDKFGIILFPMDPKVKLKLPIPSECTIFKSAMAPFKLTFETENGGRFSFIYKNGDDLRQDQLILQMFSLMDKLLKGVSQDYRLTPYKALACSKTDGYVEFVPETETFQEIKIKEHLQKLRQMNDDPNLIMENYVFSCAGYCSITYFFGIGDRHLENLLISSNGKMFHIDFGFILGRDPKPYPPPIKIRKQMIDAMGGAQSQNFKVFKSKCLQAYLFLRKSSKMIYNLFYLMLDSEIKDVHMQGMGKLFDKFSINLKDKEAEAHFLMVLQECKNAIFGQINDGIHKWAVYFK